MFQWKKPLIRLVGNELWKTGLLVCLFILTKGSANAPECKCKLGFLSFMLIQQSLKEMTKIPSQQTNLLSLWFQNWTPAFEDHWRQVQVRNSVLWKFCFFVVKPQIGKGSFVVKGSRRATFITRYVGHLKWCYFGYRETRDDKLGLWLQHRHVSSSWTGF